MARSFNRKDAIQLIKLQDCKEAMVFLLEERAKDAEIDVLGCNPEDSSMRDKLVKAQTLRQLVILIEHDFK